MKSDKMFVGFIWMGSDLGNPESDDSGRRLSVWAPSIEDATTKVVEQYGDGHVIILYDEEAGR